MLGVGVAPQGLDRLAYPLRRKLPVFVREGQHLVARGLDRACLVGGDVAGLGGEHALPGAQRRGDHNGVRLRPADEEVDVRVRGGNAAGRPDQRPGTLAVRVLAIAGMLLQIGCGKGLQDPRMAALGIVGVKADHLFSPR